MSCPEISTWATEMFGSCELGDKRRPKRLITIAQRIAANPSASFPDQTDTWGDLKAVYRLFDADKVTFCAVARPHWEHTRAQSMARKRESDVWGQVIDDVGTPADGVEYVYVCDRGADNFEVFLHLQQQKSQWVIRARDLNRRVVTDDNRTMPLSEFLNHMELRGTYELQVSVRETDCHECGPRS